MAFKTAKIDASGVPKHRACDECRSRKLACSKEPDGCARCKKEGIACVYSPQKPMGRPRKRRHAEEEPPPKPVQQPLTTAFSPPDQDHQDPFAGYDASSQPPLVLDPSLAFLGDQGSSNMEFLDLLPNAYSETLAHRHEPQIHAHGDTQGDAHCGPSTMGLDLSGVDLLGGINFDEPDPSQEADSKNVSETFQRLMLERFSQALEAPESTASGSISSRDSPASVETPDPTPPTMRAVPTVDCACLSSLFLALDSLSRLPSEVIPAMRVARNATKIAHAVINCPSCTIPLVDDPTSPPPIQCFQNLMFLGALVPSACNAYASILEMVDRETAQAKQQGRDFWFTFKDIGGLWGQIGEASSSCRVIDNYNNKTMPPDLWRMTIRAVLRLDVYGMNEVDPNAPAYAQYTQQGLKDVVTKLEERTRKRHEILDEMVASGQIPRNAPWGVIYPGKPCPPEQRNCVKILETARTALENLVIA